MINLHHEHAAICSCRGDHYKVSVHFGWYDHLAIAFRDGGKAGRSKGKQEAR